VIRTSAVAARPSINSVCHAKAAALKSVTHRDGSVVDPTAVAKTFEIG